MGQMSSATTRQPLEWLSSRNLRTELHPGNCIDMFVARPGIQRRRNNRTHGHPYKFISTEVANQFCCKYYETFCIIL